MNINDVINLDAKYYMNTFGLRMDACFVRGEGCTLYDTEGKAYTDFLAGIAVNLLGYGHPAFTKALHTQVDKLLHVSNYFYNEPQTLLAQKLVQNSCADRVFFSNSGSEANEGAVKLARKYFRERNKNRYEIISLKNSFHGRTLAMVAATGQEKYQKPYEPLPAGFVNVDAGDVNLLEAAINSRTAAVFLETIQGEGGIIEMPDGYIQQVAELCHDNGLLLIIDEIQTGMGRTGKLFSYEQFGVEPDIFTVAKALGNGVPVGAFLAKEEIAAAFTPGDHGTTFGGNPLACAAGLAVFDAIEQEGLLQKCVEAGAYLKDALNKLMGKYSFIKDVRGMGLMLGLELDGAIHAKDMMKQILHAGFVVNYVNHNTLRFVPPLIVSHGEIDNLVAALDSIFAEV